MLRRTVWLAFGAFYGVQYRRAHGDKSHLLPFREENGSNRKQLSHRLSYPVNRRTGGVRRSRRGKKKRERTSGPFNGSISSNKLNRGRIVRKAISSAIREREEIEREGSKKSHRDFSDTHNPSRVRPLPVKPASCCEYRSHRRIMTIRYICWINIIEKRARCTVRYHRGCE